MASLQFGFFLLNYPPTVIKPLAEPVAYAIAIGKQKGLKYICNWYYKGESLFFVKGYKILLICYKIHTIIKSEFNNYFKAENFKFDKIEWRNSEFTGYGKADLLHEVALFLVL